VLQLAATDAGAPDAAARFGTRRNAQIQALNGLCYVYGQRNDYPHARAASRQALALAAASPRLIDRAEACYQAGLISFRHDDYIEAERMLKQAQELYEALDHTPGLARCWYLLAWTWLRLEGSTDRVIAALERARNTFHDLDAQYDEHDSAIALANVWLWRGALSEAIRLIEENLPFFYSTAARDKIAESQIVRGEALRRMGRYTEALAAVQESYSIRLELGRTAAAQYDQIVMGNLFSNLKRYDDAWRSLQAALKTEDRLNKARALLGLAELSLHRNELKRAFQYVTEALPLVRWLRARAQLGVALRVLGQVRAADQHAELPPPSNEAPDADACFTTSIQLLEAACYEGDLGIAYAQYGAYLLNQQRIREAQAALLDAQRLLQRCGMAPWIEPIQRALQQIAQRPPALEPGQIRVRLARQGTPRGRPLRPEEFVEVVWTVESDEDTRVRARGGRIAERRARLRRLCAEAAAQGAEPTVADLARALGVTTRTVDRDLAALREAGEVLITRGAVGYSAWRDG
jgi:tetratricopeptide (TPR) repeat protein